MKKLWASAAFILVLQVPFVFGDCRSRMDMYKEDSKTADGTYVGTALRGATSCFSDGECFFCTANDEIQMERRNGEIRILASGPWLTFTPCKQLPDQLVYTLKGVYTYSEDWQKFEITGCNTSPTTGSGGGTISGGTVNASFSCVNETVGLEKTEWNDVVLKKQ